MDLVKFIYAAFLLFVLMAAVANARLDQQNDLEYKSPFKRVAGILAQGIFVPDFRPGPNFR
jgi:hypothetical protein